MKVGDTIWYRQFPYGGYIYHSGEIVGETLRSWVVLPSEAADWKRQHPDVYGLKIPKSLKGYQIGTEKDADLAKWASAHYRRIGQMVSAHISNPALLLQLAALAGYKDLPESEKENHVNTSTAEVNPR